MTSARSPARKAVRKRAGQPGLYANIHAKQERIAHGSGEKMREPGSPGAPSDEAFAQAEKGKRTAAKGAARKSAGGKAAAGKAVAGKAAAGNAGAKKPAARKRAGAGKS